MTLDEFDKKYPNFAKKLKIPDVPNPQSQTKRNNQEKVTPKTENFIPKIEWKNAISEMRNLEIPEEARQIEREFAELLNAKMSQKDIMQFLKKHKIAIKQDSKNSEKYIQMDDYKYKLSEIIAVGEVGGKIFMNYRIAGLTMLRYNHKYRDLTEDLTYRKIMIDKVEIEVTNDKIVRNLVRPIPNDTDVISTSRDYWQKWSKAVPYLRDYFFRIGEKWFGYNFDNGKLEKIYTIERWQWPTDEEFRLFFWEKERQQRKWEEFERRERELKLSSLYISPNFPIYSQTQNNNDIYLHNLQQKKKAEIQSQTQQYRNPNYTIINQTGENYGENAGIVDINGEVYKSKR